MRVLFLCTGNTCRSQMAEAFARAFARVDVEAWSAGSRPGNRVNPYALQVMAERGADLSNHRPKSLAEVPLPVDVVVSLCASAANECPAFPGAHAVEHWGLPDPADATGTEEEVLEVFRRSRDEIEQRVTDLLDRLGLLPTRLGVASGEQETIDV
ncbi:MAG TPA: arsenate reductase ArsC [Fimbriimonadaceae bacterium]|nr:arsenate reductase ArsC [Fimbriimonadaceae bacterium]